MDHDRAIKFDRPENFQYIKNSVPLSIMGSQMIQLKFNDLNA